MSALKNRALIATIVLGALFLVNSCYTKSEIRYYTQLDNYTNATGTVSFIKYNEDKTGLYLELSDLEPQFSSLVFKIVGDNLVIVQKNGIDEKVKVGSQVSISFAPEVFGDGYVIPLVSISTDEEELLGFDEGYSNLLIWLKSR